MQRPDTDWLSARSEKAHPVSLILQGKRVPEIFIDQGLNDAFYEDQLRAKNFEKICNEMNINTSIRYHNGYDHMVIISFLPSLVNMLPIMPTN